MFLRKYSKNPKFGKWVSTQRSKYILLKSGKKAFIRNERISQLVDLDPNEYLIVG